MTEKQPVSFVEYGSGMLLVGDCLARLGDLDDASIDSIVTDPPYLISFMGKDWDSADGVAGKPDVWRECLRVLKPGGHLLAFGATRTYHRMTVAIEDAGFEVRDSIHWTYGSGFPKSLDVSKAIDKAAGADREVLAEIPRGDRAGTSAGIMGQAVPRIDRVTAPATPDAARWQGWGTALKPSHEPIVVARKPLSGTVAQTVLAHGTGGLNIDGCRVGTTVETWPATRNYSAKEMSRPGSTRASDAHTQPTGDAPAGRWPANTVFTHAAGCQATGETCVPGCPVAALDRQSGVSTSRAHAGTEKATKRTSMSGGAMSSAASAHSDEGGASRYFTQTTWEPEWDDPFLYIPKPSKRERNAGLDGKPAKGKVFNGQSNKPASKKDGSVEDKFSTEPQANIHPTVKPVALMRHLVRLVTPPGGTVLDPFLGSGTTAVAAILEGFTWVGCEMTPDYLPIIDGRIQHAEKQNTQLEL